MFNNATDFTVTAAEVIDADGSLTRLNSPTIVEFKNLPLGIHYGHGESNPPTPAPAPTSGSAAVRTRRLGMFDGAARFNIVGAHVSHVPGNVVRENSGTNLTIDFATQHQQQQSTTQGSYHTPHYTAGRYDNTSQPPFNDSTSPAYVSYPTNYSTQSSRTEHSNWQAYGQGYYSHGTTASQRKAPPPYTKNAANVPLRHKHVKPQRYRLSRMKRNANSKFRVDRATAERGNSFRVQDAPAA